MAGKMQNANDGSVTKDIIVKRISASQFEVYDGSKLPDKKTEPPEKTSDKKKNEEELKTLLPRQTVIRRAPPKAGKDVSPAKRRKTDRQQASANSVILIKDAIMYRIVDILMWKVIGETQLRAYGYPTASTHQVLLRAVRDNSVGPIAKKVDNTLKGHDCVENISCFTSHVTQFLDAFAPNLSTRWDRRKYSTVELLRRIYHEDLIPFLRCLDLRNNVIPLQCHSDIVLLEKWENQKFTAVTWSGEKYLSQMKLECPKCPRCSNRHF